MLKKALSIPLSARQRNSGLPALNSPTEGGGKTQEECGCWHYLVTDSAGIRPRLEACYTKHSKQGGKRFDAGTVVQVNQRRRAGWTNWLSLASGDGWLFDVSPKNRKVRLIEVEVQQGNWDYEVCVDALVVVPCPQLGVLQSSGSFFMHAGDEVRAVERVRPMLGRGAFFRLAGEHGWVPDFVAGQQTLRLRHSSRCYSPVNSECTTKPSLGSGQDDSAEVEIGRWAYVVLDPSGITLRSSPTYDKSAKLHIRLEEGEIVNVVERRACEDARFLRVKHPDSAWGFENQPGKVSVARMMEVEVEEGGWFYQVVADGGCAPRSRCSSCASKAGPLLEKEAIVPISQRVTVGSTTFLRLKDADGWLFDHKDAKPVMEGPLNVVKLCSASATVIAPDGVQLLRSPSDEPWAVTNMMLLHRAKVSVQLKVDVRDETWMKISKPGGMEGWVPAGCLDLDNVLCSKPGWAR